MIKNYSLSRPVFVKILCTILGLSFILSSTSLSAQPQISSNESMSAQSEKVIVGADRLFSEYAHLIKGKKLALVSNHIGVLADGTHLADALYNYPNAELKVLMGMHFNIRSNDYSLPKDEEDDIDSQTGLPKYSLYGSRHQPTKDILEDVEVILFDIQEVGARFYEHVNILGFVMETASQHNMEVIVLDRPNPITGIKTDGFVTDDEFLYTFGAYAKLPVIHGMTVGEIAKMYNAEKMLRGQKQVNLQVVELLNWERNMWFNETGLPWIKPSPNLPTFDALLAYTGTCLFEGINVSAGRGTDKPFQYIGAPWVNSKAVIEALEPLHLPGVQFEYVQFTPQKMPFHSRNPYLANELCQGVYVNITDRDLFESYRVGIALLWALHNVHPQEMTWDQETMNRLVSTNRLEQLLFSDATPSEIYDSWKAELANFNTIRAKYLLY